MSDMWITWLELLNGISTILVVRKNRYVSCPNLRLSLDIDCPALDLGIRVDYSALRQADVVQELSLALAFACWKVVNPWAEDVNPTVSD